MANISGVFSETLQEITKTKLEELAKRRASFEKSKSDAIACATASAGDTIRVVEALSTGVKSCFGIALDDSGSVILQRTKHHQLEIELKNIDRFLTQARYDPSISTEMLRGWGELLERHLETQSRKYEFADLYGKLVTEWLEADRASSKGHSSTDEGFEDLGNAAKLEGRIEWEKNVFTPAEVDEDAISDYLEELFGIHAPQDSPKGKVNGALDRLRKVVERESSQIASDTAFNVQTLKWTISSLVSSKLLPDEKREVLKDFSGNEIILNEIADVLNMRLAALDSWSWGDEVLVEQHRQISGKYNVNMQEDLLQAIFLQYIGVKWSLLFKNAFDGFYDYGNGDAWLRMGTKIPLGHKQRLEECLGALRHHKSLQSKRQALFRYNYFVSQLLTSVPELLRQKTDDGEEEAEYSSIRKARKMTASAAPPQPTSTGASLFGIPSTTAAAFGAPSVSGAFGVQSTGQFGIPSTTAAAFGASSVSAAPPQPTSTGASLFGIPSTTAAAFGAPSVGGAFGAQSTGQGGGHGNPLFGSAAQVYRPAFSQCQEKVFEATYKLSHVPIHLKQSLLHIFSTDIAIETATKGEISAFHSVLRDWNPLLPHETILAVLKFFGVSSKWINFFSSFLRAPLRFVGDDPSSTVPRVRRRGTPATHQLSDVFGETVLFCLDFAVNQATDGEPLWRIRDDIWFWSSSSVTTVKAWTAVSGFAKVTGTSLEGEKSGSVRISNITLREGDKSRSVDPTLPQGDLRWGFLRLNPSAGRFEIDQAMVDKHIVELRKQLDEKHGSVLGFIQAWNSFAASFFSSNFGKPANCFGRSHVDEMLSTHRRIQQDVFATAFGVGGSSRNATSVVDFLKKVIEMRFGVTDIPDGYLFFPAELGGLSLQSPFVTLQQIRESTLESPEELLERLFKAERASYEYAKKLYEQSGQQTVVHPDSVFWNGRRVNRFHKPFISFDEYVVYREAFEHRLHDGIVGSYTVSDVFDELREEPTPQPINAEHNENGAIGTALSRLNSGGTHGGTVTSRSIAHPWNSMTPYWQWVTMMYGPEIVERFGGLSLVDAGLLPMGMVSIFRQKRVTWKE
ncbi:hypothetical protein PspLS_04580 [Pyricularia sp. CBS 133598]|nr:hypothetical protein PspLS_04580 [Pyricularia sp. CBS 133598]